MRNGLGMHTMHLHRDNRCIKSSPFKVEAIGVFGEARGMIDKLTHYSRIVRVGERTPYALIYL